MCKLCPYRRSVGAALAVAAAWLVAAEPSAADGNSRTFFDTLVLDVGQPDPHDSNEFTFDKFDTGFGTLTEVTIKLRSDFTGSVRFHGVQGEGYFHYTPRNVVESEITGIPDPPVVIVDNLLPTRTCHIGRPGGPLEVGCTLYGDGTLSDSVTVTGAAMADYIGPGTFTIRVTQKDRSDYFGTLPDGSAYTALTYDPDMSSKIALTVRYEYVAERPVRFDTDYDRDVDVTDFTAPGNGFLECFTRPKGAPGFTPPARGCHMHDGDDDGDVDAADFHAFILAFTGPAPG